MPLKNAEIISWKLSEVLAVLELRSVWKLKRVFFHSKNKTPVLGITKPV